MPSLSPPLLTLNVGSSSVKLTVFSSDHTEQTQLDPSGSPLEQLHNVGTRHGAPAAVIHRVVHGGDRFTRPHVIDDAVQSAIEQLSELAPLHNPPTLKWIRAAREAWPGSRQVAVFDTAFFAGLPEVARRYALPQPLAREWSVRRFGFHGLAHQDLWQQYRGLGEGTRGRLISLQLGSGCSIAAIRDGEPLDTSMGFSPLEGLVMGSRCGDLDPGAIIYLQRKAGLSTDQLEQMLNHDCGLKGLSGQSSDMRKLLASDDAASRTAIDVFCYRASKYIGAYLTVLGGADAIAFGGGIGEHLPAIRAQILQPLAWAGVRVDEEANRVACGQRARVSSPGSAVEVWVYPVDEAQVMLRQAQGVLNG